MNTPRPLSIVILLLIAACSETEEGDQSRVVAQQQDEAPVVQRVDGGNMTTTAVAPPPQVGSKVFVVDMSVDAAGAVTLTNPRVQYGEAPNDLGNPPMFSARLLDSLGTVVDSKPLWDPRWTFVWNDEQDRDFVDLGDAADVAVVFPFDRGATSVAVFRGKERLALIDISETLAGFCAKHREDPDCRDEQEQRTPE